MVQMCNSCGKMLNEGDIVTVMVKSTYHVLNSTIAYALDKHTMEAIPDTLKHYDKCY